MTLTQAGWIAVGERGFSLTAQGHRALESGQVPESRMEQDKVSRILMDRLSGGIISNTRATFVSEQDIEESGKADSVLRLPSRVHEWELDEGQVHRFLPHRKGDWVARIEKIWMTAKGDFWLPVNVDTSKGRVYLLPSEWQSRLEDEILKEARAREGRLPYSKRAQRWRWDRTRSSSPDDEIGDTWGTRWSAEINPDDFVFSADAHRSLLVRALGEAAQSVFIVSSFLRVQVLQELYPEFRRALERGVSIDILWGYDGSEPGSGLEALQLLKKFAYDCSGLPGRLRFNSSAAGSHAKLLLWDSLDRYYCCVGSFNWLSSRSPDSLTRNDMMNVSLQVSQPGFVSAIARTISGFWSRVSSERLGSSRARLEMIAAELDRRDATLAEEASLPRIGIVRDLEHEGLLAALIRSARARFFLSSHQLGQIGPSRLGFKRSVPESTKDGLAKIVYGETDLDQDHLDRIVSTSAISLLHLPGAHAKVCISDDVAYVGSYNFLSADPYGTASGARELGLVLVGASAVEPLTRWADGLLGKGE